MPSPITQNENLRDFLSTSRVSARRSVPVSESSDAEIYEVPSSLAEERRRIRVHTAEGTDIRGSIYMEGTHFDRRVSTVMNDSREFISLTDAEIFFRGRRVSRTDFICINKTSIAYVMEDGEIPHPIYQEA